MDFIWKKKSNRKAFKCNFSIITNATTKECSFEVNGINYLCYYYGDSDILEVRDCTNDHLFTYEGLPYNSTLNDANEALEKWLNGEIHFDQDY